MDPWGSTWTPLGSLAIKDQGQIVLKDQMQKRSSKLRSSKLIITCLDNLKLYMHSWQHIYLCAKLYTGVIHLVRTYEGGRGGPNKRVRLRTRGKGADTSKYVRKVKTKRFLRMYSVIFSFARIFHLFYQQNCFCTPLVVLVKQLNDPP